MMNSIKEEWSKKPRVLFVDLQAKLRCKGGQGTTEYAILVGVLVVIAILAIVVFRPKLQELWDAITSGMESL